MNIGIKREVKIYVFISIFCILGNDTIIREEEKGVRKMISDDSVKLLKECSAGVKTAVNSIEEVITEVRSEKLKQMLEESKRDHESLGDEIHEVLNKYHDTEKDPNPMARAMSWMKINMKLWQDTEDKVIADLMIDGCNMGIKSLYGYMHQYKNANDTVTNLAEKLVKIEERLMVDLREFL